MKKKAKVDPQRVKRRAEVIKGRVRRQKHLQSLAALTAEDLALGRILH